MLTFDFLFFWSLNVPIESFPKLLWVVRDFVQDTGELTPTEWLHSLLHSRRRDTSKDDKISLLSLFPSIEAFTLSLPAGEKKILRRLDLASNDTLSEDYKHDLEQLRYKIFTSITPKTRGGVPLSGFGISFSLVEFLCSQRIRFYSHCVIFQLWHRCWSFSSVLRTMAKFPFVCVEMRMTFLLKFWSLPTFMSLCLWVTSTIQITVHSVWDTFLQQQAATAKTECVRIYRHNTSSLEMKTTAQLHAIHTEIKQRLLHLVRQMLVGLENLLASEINNVDVHPFPFSHTHTHTFVCFFRHSCDFSFFFILSKEKRVLFNSFLSLKNILEEEFQQLIKENEQKISKYCQSVYENLVQTYEKEMKALTLPVKRSTLQQLYLDKSTSILTAFDNKTIQFSDTKPYLWWKQLLQVLFRFIPFSSHSFSDISSLCFFLCEYFLRKIWSRYVLKSLNKIWTCWTNS